MLNPVPQRGAMGCGVACVAYVLGKTYVATNSRHFARSVVPAGDDHTRGYSRKALMLALAHARVEVAECRYRSEWRLTRAAKLERIPVGAIVLVERYPHDRERHYVVRGPGCWIDPLDPDESTPSSTGQVRTRLPRSWMPIGYIRCAHRP